MASLHKRRGAMAEINVVPYIDVMLVLLVIFMVTTPLLTQGVKVDLPNAAAKPLPQQESAVIISIKSDGMLWIEISGDKDSQKSVGQANPDGLKALLSEVQAIRASKPTAPVLINGDKTVPYGVVIKVMARLRSEADLQDVGLMTQPGDEK